MAILLILLIFLFPANANAKSSFATASNSFLQSEEDIDYYCLRLSYAAIEGREKDANGITWLAISGGARVVYDNPAAISTGADASVKESMSQPYYLDPTRPETPEGYSPARQRSYQLLNAIYGDNAAAIQKNLATTPFFTKNLRVAKLAAPSFAAITRELAPVANTYKDLLAPDGAFHWRRIAGENALSAHSYGIALDMGVKEAPYWRWSKVFPHPMQKTYPSEIVSAFEKNGFIWGGKWHEYDLMHYEYRPEIICKARMKEAMKKK